MGKTSLFSVLCLACIVSLSASQNIPENTSQDLLTTTFYIQNLKYGETSNYEIKAMVMGFFSVAGATPQTVIISNGSPCVEVYVEIAGGGDNSLLTTLFKSLVESGIEEGETRLYFSFDGCDVKTDVAPNYVLEIKFFIQNMTWTDKLKDTTSQDYQQLAGMVREYFSSLRGNMKAPYFEKSHGCVQVFFQLESDRFLNPFGVLTALKTDKFFLNGVGHPVSTEPCEPNAGDKDQCPNPTKKYLTTCESTCSDAYPCQAGFKCCYNGCGDSCIRVGYSISIHATVVLDMPWLLSLTDVRSDSYRGMGKALQNMIAEQFGEILHAVDIHRYGHFSNEDMRNATKASLTLYFNRDVPNDYIHTMQLKVMKAVVPMWSANYKVAMFQMGKEGQCGFTVCHGICKNPLNASPYCSCDQGRFGADCNLFDCRHDLFSTVADLSKNYCRDRGQCVHQEYDNKDTVSFTSGRPKRQIAPRPTYECECEAPYMGETCQYMLCDYFTNPCNGHGICTGIWEEGQLCKCDDGWGGLFCEKKGNDAAMSTCEIRKRLMEFVHKQITGEVEMMDSLLVPMRSLLKMMKAHEYSVPHCLPRDNSGLGGSFYSECHYNASSGSKIECGCLGFDGEPNYYIYFGEGDCRVFNGNVEIFKNSVYIGNTSWNSAFGDVESKEYAQVFAQVESVMISYGGAVKNMQLIPIGANCVEMELEVVLEPSRAIDIISNQFLSKQILINGEYKGLRMEPCEREVDVNSCPHHSGDSDFSICLYQCSPEAAVSGCDAGETCCPLACGGGQCLELGFMHRVAVNITLSVPYKSEYSDTTSADYLIFMAQLARSLSSFIDDSQLDGYETLNVIGVYEASDVVEEGSLGWGAVNETRPGRQRRQAVPDYTTVAIALLFNKEIDVDTLMALSKEMVLTGTFTFDGEVHSVISVKPGYAGLCGGRSCHPSSICVDQYGGGQTCACPKGRSGPSCQSMNCFDENGKSVCKNGGRCEKDMWRDGFSQCKCRPGFGGDMCDFNMCSYFKPDACNTGKCIFHPDKMAICECPAGKGGLFCELDKSDNLTSCEVLSRLMNFVVKTLSGEMSSKLTIPMVEFLEKGGMMQSVLRVPTCWGHDQGHYGEHKYYCQYDSRAGEQIGDCVCVEGNGRPNYKSWIDGQCVGSNTTSCDQRPCHHNGTCVPLGRSDYYCKCPLGYEGKHCERTSYGFCYNDMMPLYQDDGSARSCLAQKCPFGFSCDGRMVENSYCCLNESFLCSLDNLCKNNGNCVGDIYNGKVCDCPSGKDGLFCEKDFDGVKLTRCQKQQRFYAWVTELLARRQSMPSGVTLQDLQRILKHLGMTYFLENICDDQGNFKATVEGYNIYDLSQKRKVCLNREGVIDESCQYSICEHLETDAMKFCRNGGRCVGDVLQQLCDCRGTGYHGVACEQPGDAGAMSQCQQARMVSEFALGILNGSAELYPGMDAKRLMTNILTLFNSTSIFVPDCNSNGIFTGRGCAHMLNNTNEMMCYCSNLMGLPTTYEKKYQGLPDHCPYDEQKPDNGCLTGSGPDCERPASWCSDRVKCKKGEKCYKSVPCDEAGCHADMMEATCVPAELDLPCEPVSCPHNPNKKCMPCGEEGRCFHVKKGMGESGRNGGKNDKDSSEKKKEKDDNDSGEKKKGKDDNDSEEEGRDNGDYKPYEKEKDEYDSSEDEYYGDDDYKTLMGMKLKDNDNYVCKCPKGRGGKRCEIREDVCSIVPSDLCTHGCIGDVENGVLCRCPEGFSGFLCNKPAHTRCQVQKAFFDDVIAILSKEMKDVKYNTKEYADLVRVITDKFTESRTYIPNLSCSSDGLYDKLQCNFNIYSLTKDMCFCVDYHGEYVSSNTKPYINYPVCTGPADFRVIGYEICKLEGLCLNGGRCVFDVYQGKICDCAKGFDGLFCQHKVSEPEESAPLSFCNYLEDSFLTAQSIVQEQNSEWLGAVPNIQLYLNLTWMMIGTENRNIRGYQRDLTGMKVECNDDGSFKPYVCDRLFSTNEVLACYCSGFKGPIISTEAADEKSPKCDWNKVQCDEIKERCPKAPCEHGHRVDLHQCPTCECKRPCEGVACKEDERCVVVKNEKNCKGKRGCEKAVCRPKHKPGMCPGLEASTYSSIIGGGINREGYQGNDKPKGQGQGQGHGLDKTELPNKENLPIKDKEEGGKSKGQDYMDDMEGMQCRIECADDADCEGKEKCCGLCGNTCVQPVVPDNCIDSKKLAMNKLNLILETQKGLHHNMSRSLYMTLFHLSATHEIWIPTCEGNGFIPTQCKYSIAKWRDEGVREATECFCVDRRGHPIKGSMAVHEDDLDSCKVKPLSCPHPSPMEDYSRSNKHDKCESDMDCSMADKCCSNGIKDVCTKPVDPAETSSTIDMMMESLCKLAPDACEAGSTCNGLWKSEGKSCTCTYNRKGPFCEVAKSASDPEMSVCEMKRYALERFNESIAEYRKSEAFGVELQPHQLKGVLKVLEKLIGSWEPEDRDRKYKKMSMIYYKCDEEGDFFSMQCSLNMHTGMKEACFCVDREGKELLGTRKRVKDGMPRCGGKEPSCKVGTPLRNDDGEVRSCGKYSTCPGIGYECVRGMYGELQCCPSGHDEDLCMMPSDGGFECKKEADTSPSSTPMTPVTRYAFNWFKSQCEAFQFRGCGGNKNHFMTMEDCQNRCIDKIHLGICPATFKITKKTDCKDTCKADWNCPNDRFKCCQSSCGKHCVPSFSSSPKKGMCPFGHRGKQCISDTDCGPGGDCYIAVYGTGEMGYCCVDVQKVDLCHVKPWMAISKKEMDRRNKDDDSWDKDDDSRDKDDGDSRDKDDGDSRDKDDGDSRDKNDMYGKDKGDKDMEGKDKGDKEMGGKGEGDDDDDSAEKKRDLAMMCKEMKQRFFYNHDTRKCEEMYVCEATDFNSFDSMEDCCNLCGSENRCKAGKCPKIEPSVYLSSKNECRADSDCKGNRICCYNGYAMSCKLPMFDTDGEEAMTKCQSDRFEAKRARDATSIAGCSINYVPSCDERTGMYSRHQCLTSLGTCWCVTDHGHYIPNTMARGVARCDDIPDLTMEVADKNPKNISSVEFEVCPDNTPVHCCKPALCMKECRGHPEAVCRINPCGGCKAEYFDASGNQVNCDEGLSLCEQELKTAANIMMEHRITASNHRKLDQAGNGDDDMDGKQYIDDMEEPRIIRSDVPLRCQQMPSSGDCAGHERAWFYHPDTRQCSMFMYSTCGGNDNRFKTPEECYSVCDPGSDPCESTTCSTSNPTCKIIYSEDCYKDEELCVVNSVCTSEPSLNPNMPEGIYLPQCLLVSGDYNFKQCHHGYCWCVDSQGKYNRGLTSVRDPADLECLENGPSKTSVLKVEQCIDGSNPRVGCLKECTHKTCPGHPEAICKVDLCSNKCATKFVDAKTSQEVTCGSDTCQVFRFDNDNRDGKCKSEVLCDGKGVKTCPRDVCDNAKGKLCPKNPCAVCMVDPCSCKPYFVDVTTRKRLNDKQCRYVTKGACHLKTCNMLVEMEGAQRSGLEVKEIDLPECKGNGKFEPKQCSSPGDCHCVGEDGAKVGEVSRNGKCNAIKETKSVKATLSFKGDFAKMKRENKLKQFKAGIMKYFTEELGIPQENIKMGEPYAGSIKVDVTIVPSKNTTDSPDLGLYFTTVDQVVDTASMAIDVDGEVFTVDPATSSLVASTEDDDGDGNNGDGKERDDDDSGLSNKDKIIIGAAGGAAGLAFLILIAYCCCCRERKKKDPVDDTFTHETHRTKTENIYDNPDMTFKNKGYQPEQDHYMKVRV